MLPGCSLTLFPRLPGALSGAFHTPCPHPPSVRLPTALFGPLPAAAMDHPPPVRPASLASCAIPACPPPVPSRASNGQRQRRRKTGTIAGKPAKENQVRKGSTSLQEGPSQYLTFVDRQPPRPLKEQKYEKRKQKRTKLQRQVEQAAIAYSWSEALALGSVSAPVMGTAAARWAAVRVMVAPVGNQAVVARGVGLGGKGASRRPTIPGASPRREPRAHGRALCPSVMSKRSCRRKGATGSDSRQA